MSCMNEIFTSTIPIVDEVYVIIEIRMSCRHTIDDKNKRVF